MAESNLVLIGDYKWSDDLSYMRTLTCVNHPTARYLTKNPFIRSVHVRKLPEGDIPRTETGECKCLFHELAVVVDESHAPEELTNE